MATFTSFSYLTVVACCLVVLFGTASAIDTPGELMSAHRTPADSKSARLNGVSLAPPSADGGAKLRIVDGAYPVYYSVARTNGRFGKRIKAYGIDEYDQMKRRATRKTTADIRK